jgi:hypothetical protein
VPVQAQTRQEILHVCFRKHEGRLVCGETPELSHPVERTRLSLPQRLSRRRLYWRRVRRRNAQARFTRAWRSSAVGTGQEKPSTTRVPLPRTGAGAPLAHARRGLACPKDRADLRACGRAACRAGPRSDPCAGKLHRALLSALFLCREQARARLWQTVR